MNKCKIWVIGLLLALFSFIITWLVLNKTHHANGWDGYYYVMQIHTFFRDGVMHASDRSLFYSFLIGLSYVCPNEVITVKIGTSILSMLFTVICFSIVLNKYNWKIATFISIITIVSPMATFFAIQFPKNLMGICFLLIFMSMIDQDNYKWAIVFFIGSFLIHRSSAVIALLYICNIQIGIFFRYKVITVISIILIFLIIISSLFMKGTIHWSDLMRFKDSFNIRPQIAFYSFYDIWNSKINLMWIIELILAFIGIVVYTYNSIKTRKNYLWIFIMIILLFPFFKLDTSTIGYRLFLVAYMLFMTSVFPDILLVIKDKMFMTVGILLLLMFPFTYQSYVPSFFDLPYDNYMAISLIVKQKKKHSLVIAHKGLKEILVLKGIEAINWNLLDTINTDRIIHGMTFYELKKLNYKEYLGNGYFITTNKDWQHFCKLEHSQNVKNKIYSWANPYQTKPYFLRKGEN